MPQLEFAWLGSCFNKALLPEGVIHWSEAKDHLNETVSIYGEVTSTYFNWKKYERFVGCYELDMEPPPTFIEVGARYPSRELVKIVIWGRDWKNFHRLPDFMFKDHAIVFTGSPYLYKDVVTVQISKPESIQIVEPIEGLYVARAAAVAGGLYQSVFSGGSSDGLEEDYYGDESRGVVYDDCGKAYEVMNLSAYGGEIMYWDEDNGWLTDLP